LDLGDETTKDPAQSPCPAEPAEVPNITGNECHHSKIMTAAESMQCIGGK
jgi:hypothetical protein